MVIQLTCYVVLDRLVVQASAMTAGEGEPHSWTRLVFEAWPVGEADTSEPWDMLGEIAQCLTERCAAAALDRPRF